MHTITEVLEVTSILFSGLPLHDVLADFCGHMAQLAGVDSCTVFQWDRPHNTLVLLADYVAPEADTPFEAASQAGAVYPLDHYPATAKILTEQTPLVINVNDPAADEAEKTLLQAFHQSQALLTPLVYQGQSVGLLKLAASSNAPGRFTGSQMDVYQAMANQAAMVIENDRLYREAAEGQLHAEAMQVISRALASELDYERIVSDVAEFAFRLVNARFVYVAVPEGDGFRRVATAGREEEIDGAYAWLSSPAQRLLAQAVEEKRPVNVADVPNIPGLTRRPEEMEGWEWRSVVAVPLLSHNRVAGVLAAYAYEPDFFGAGDVAILMSLASQAAVAIQNARLFAELEAQREELHQVSLRLVNAQEDERRRISRELHDELGQALTALKINLDVARRTLPADAPAKLRRSIHEAGALAVKTLETARSLSLELHPAMLDDLGLVAALRWEIDRFEQRTGQTVHFKASTGDIALRPELEITIYRIITEALTNAARHARASEIRVSLEVTNRRAEVIIEDNGVGFDAKSWLNSPAKRQSLGLVSMRERAGLLGGRLNINSAPGQGTRIEGIIPTGL